LPDFQLKATDAAGTETEFFLNDIDPDGTWHFRRNPSITRPATSLIRHTTDPDPIPYLTPEVMLLFKAKHHRPNHDPAFPHTLLPPPRRTTRLAQTRLGPNSPRRRVARAARVTPRDRSAAGHGHVPPLRRSARRVTGGFASAPPDVAL